METPRTGETTGFSIPLTTEEAEASPLPLYCQMIETLIEREKPKLEPIMGDIIGYKLYGRLDDGTRVQLSKTFDPCNPNEKISYYVITRKDKNKRRDRVTEYIYTIGGEYPIEQFIECVRAKPGIQQHQETGMKDVRGLRNHFNFSDKEWKDVEQFVNEARFGKGRLRATDG